MCSFGFSRDCQQASYRDHTILCSGALYLSSLGIISALVRTCASCMFTSQHGLKSLLQIYISPMLHGGEFPVGLVVGNGNCG